jgi:3-deoxy-7-phosphoheptulonate synthase
MAYPTNNLRITSSRVVLPPIFLEEEMPLTDNASRTVFEARRQIVDILNGADDRLIVVVGPCSIHDPIAAMEYARLLKEAIAELSSDLMIVMRVYFEKPRTTLGWKGLINDPYFDESFRISDGLRIARRLLLDLAEMGVPAGTEYLDMISPQYVSDLISWGAIGARTTESQVHRQLASGLSCPVGFKNGTSGNVQIAIEAILSASHPHTFLGSTETGQSAILLTSGNPDCHVILRGGRQIANYDSASVTSTTEQMEKAGVKPRVMIDCSHDNSGKDHRKQGFVCRAVSEQITSGERRIMGVMIESNLVAGSQILVNGKTLVYGQSITDACIDWPETQVLLRELASATHQRRANLGVGQV